MKQQLGTFQPSARALGAFVGALALTLSLSARADSYSDFVPLYQQYGTCVAALTGTTVEQAVGEGECYFSYLGLLKGSPNPDLALAGENLDKLVQSDVSSNSSVTALTNACNSTGPSNSNTYCQQAVEGVAAIQGVRVANWGTYAKFN